MLPGDTKAMANGLMKKTATYTFNQLFKKCPQGQFGGKYRTVLQTEDETYKTVSQELYEHI